MFMSITTIIPVVVGGQGMVNKNTIVGIKKVSRNTFLSKMQLIVLMCMAHIQRKNNFNPICTIKFEIFN